jgi:aryl-alcohol dehydrogenase-like predicted oxidoreductase
MQYRKLGNTDMTISAVGYGCMGLSHAFGIPLTTAEAVKRIDAAYDYGYRFFDTAECYTGTNSDGTTAYNEEVVGEAIKKYRDKIVLATKCGVSFGDGKMYLHSSPEDIRKAVEGSLKRLGTDYIDLYYQHRVDPKVEPEVVADTMAQLIKEGKIRSWGISCVEEDYLRRAHAVCPVSAVQNMYSVIDRDTERLFGVFEELGITLVAYTPLAKGFLSGKYIERPTFEHPEDNRSGRYQFSEEGFKVYQAALDLIRSKADEKNATLAQISLAWMMSKKPWISPIPGTRTIERIKENGDASDIVLSAEEVKEIDDALNKLHLVDTAAARIKPVVYGDKK